MKQWNNETMEQGFTPLESQSEPLHCNEQKAKPRYRTALPLCNGAKPPIGSVRSKGRFLFRTLTGFTLLEVLIAIFIITLVMGGAFTLVWQTANSTTVASSRLAASYLCQEGLELVRQKRDSNWLSSKSVPAFPWDSGLNAGQWEMDYNDSALVSYSDRYLKVPLLGPQFYNYESGANTPFKRKLTIDKATTDVLKVSVEVSWREHGRLHRVTAEEHLYNSFKP